MGLQSQTLLSTHTYLRQSHSIYSNLHLVLTHGITQNIVLSLLHGVLLGVSGSIQFGSVIQSCPTLCHPMNRSTPGLPVHQQLPEFTQTHVH